ncbi:MAG: amino acid ABC transporter substrate-binding protein, partial [Chlorobiaceae bacterium]|nr:amino acid ABC transporter substrate-binding protein [Chlorobiaceae bacterium]
MTIWRARYIAALVLIFLVISSGCSKREKFQRLDQLDGKDFAILTGSVCDKLVLE